LPTNQNPPPNSTLSSLTLIPNTPPPKSSSLAPSSPHIHFGYKVCAKTSVPKPNPKAIIPATF